MQHQTPSPDPLAQALAEAHLFAHNQAEHGFPDWGSFIFSSPAPISCGIWKLLRPGIQVMIVESYEYAGDPPVIPLTRPIGIQVLSGQIEVTAILHREPVTSTLEANGPSLRLANPEIRFRTNPIGDTCTMLVVRLQPFERPTIETWRVARFGEGQTEKLKEKARQLITS